MSQTKYDDIQQKLQCVFKSGAQCKKTKQLVKVPKLKRFILTTDVRVSKNVLENLQGSSDSQHWSNTDLIW